MSDPERPQTLAPIVVEGRNCWRIERANKARMIVDAADYYALLERLMAGAKERILLIGWDFDPRIPLIPDEQGKGESLGHYLLRLAKDQPKRDIDILRWNFGGLKHLLRAVDRHDDPALENDQIDQFSARQRAPGRVQPPPEGRGVRRSSGGVRRHRCQLDAVGHARSCRR